MSATDTYNGWTNYATWGVALVLDNDEGTYSHVWDVLVRRATEAAAESDIGKPAYYLADALKDYTEELCGLESDNDELSMMARQVIAAGLCEVDWDEIAANVLSGAEAA